MVVQPLVGPEPSSTVAGAKVAQLGLEVSETSHQLGLVKLKVRVQQVFLVIVGPVELAPFVRALVPRVRAHEPGHSLVDSQMSRQVSSEVLFAHWTVVLSVLCLFVLRQVFEEHSMGGGRVVQRQFFLLLIRLADIRLGRICVAVVVVMTVVDMVVCVMVAVVMGMGMVALNVTLESMGGGSGLKG